MLRLSIICVFSFFTSWSSAWACSCGGPPVLVSEFLKEVKVVYGTPQKTEWLGRNVPLPVDDVEWWKNSHKRTMTKLIDVQHLLDDDQQELSFYHSPDGASCGIAPRMGSEKWFVLNEDADGRFSYFLCSASRIPIGAILDYHLSGNDPLVPSRSVCYSYIRQVEKARRDGDSVPEDNLNCGFWSKENLKRLNTLRRDLEKQERTLPVKLQNDK